MVATDVPGSAGPLTDRAEQTGPPERPRAPDREIALVTLARNRWRDGELELMDARRNYWQNLAFFVGDQWNGWNEARRQLVALATNSIIPGAGRSRLTINRIEPNVINVVARLLATPLGFEVPPTDAADDVISGAQLAEDVLEAEHHDQQWGRIRYDGIFHAIMGGTSAITVEWDGQAGETLEVDHATNRVVGTGAARLRALAITDFCVEPGVTDVRRARWWMCGLAMPPREAQAMYGMGWTPKADATQLLSPLQTKLLSRTRGSQEQNQCLVLCMYERPNPKVTAGRYVVIINDRIVHETDWPFPFKDRLNIVPFRQEHVSGKWIGWTYMNAAIKLQATYNFYRSCLAEHFKKVGIARLLLPNGMDEDDFDDNPGSVIPYEPGLNGAKPEYLLAPPMPGWMGDELNNTRQELDEIMHVSQVSQGQSIGDRASGQAIALLSEKDDSPLGLMGTEQAEGWAAIAEMVLALYADRATETRKISLRAAGNTPRTRSFTGKMLHGQTRVYVDPDTTKPVSKAAMQAFAKDLWDRQIIKDPGVYARLSQLPTNLLDEVIEADVASATHENTLLSIGVAVVPEDFENHAVHIAEHNRFRKSRAYRYAEPAVRDLVDMHIQAHEVMAHEELGAQQGRAEQTPGLAAVPQAHEPIGSVVPPDWAEAQAGVNLPPAPDGSGSPSYPGGGGPPTNGASAPPVPDSGSPDLGPGVSAPGLTSGVT